MTIKRTMMIGLIGMASMLSPFAQSDELQTLRNLERERAILVEMMFDDSLAREKRQNQIEHSIRRLVDLERMVLRDQRLEGNTDTLVRRAFNNYDLTFLAHASLEKRHSVIGHWVDQVGLSTNSILAAQVRSR